jgi:hypothetical protein
VTLTMCDAPGIPALFCRFGRERDYGGVRRGSRFVHEVGRRPPEAGAIAPYAGHGVREGMDIVARRLV